MGRRIIILVCFAAVYAPAMAVRYGVPCAPAAAHMVLRGDTASKPTVYDTVALELRVIDYADQLYRLQVEDTSSRYGANSKQAKLLYKKMRVAACQCRA